MRELGTIRPESPAGCPNPYLNYSSNSPSMFCLVLAFHHACRP